MTAWTPIAKGREGSYQTLHEAPMSLHEARAAYDAGTHDMATRRLPDGSGYEIVVRPRPVPSTRLPYFNAKWDANGAYVAPQSTRDTRRVESRRAPAPYANNVRPGPRR